MNKVTHVTPFLILLIAGISYLTCGCKEQKQDSIQIMTVTRTGYAERNPLFEPMEKKCPPVEFEKMVEDYSRNASLSVFELCNIDSLVAKIKQPTNAVLAYIKSACSEQTLSELARWNENAFAETVKLDAYLRADINKIINGPLLYDSQRFAGIELRPKERDLIADGVRTNDCPLLNRLLLEDALPSEISRLPRKLRLELKMASQRQYTNYMAILIKHGADVEGTERLLRENEKEQAVILLQKVAADVRPSESSQK
jgi:hypothetical protein